MRKIPRSLDLVKQEIEKLKGKNIKMQVNKGRKRMVNYEGVVEDIYNSVFVVSVVKEKKVPIANGDSKMSALIEVYAHPKKLSYSFCDVLCGDVKIAINK